MARAEGTAPSLKPAAPSEQWMLSPERLRARCEPGALPPIPTGEAAVPEIGAIGQDRAVDALNFGMSVAARGFNIFVAGVPGTRRMSTARLTAERAASTRPAPCDWCYVYNFSQPDSPLAIALPAGNGPRFAEQMDALITATRRQIGEAFASEDYRRRREQITHEAHRQRQAILENLAETARKQGFALSVSAIGIATIPLVDNRPMTDEEFEHLPREKQEELSERAESLREQIDAALAQVRTVEKNAHDRIAQLNRDVAEFVIGPLIRALGTEYHNVPEIGRYLDGVRDDIVARVDEFQAGPETGEEGAGEAGALLRELTESSREAFFDRYKVNVLVTSQDQTTAPVVVESNPTYYNLLGRIEYHARFGVLVTSFRMIKPGALHRANGGYLILDALDVLRSPFAWEALKRVLRTGQIQIENLGQQFSATPTTSLRPAPIPLDVKVILVGTPELYYLLYFYDEDFPRLFKVKADFDTVMDRTPEHVARYAAFIRSQVNREKLRPFEPAAIAAVVDHASRLAQHQRKLTTRLSEISDLLVEASQAAGVAGSPTVHAAHVAHAIDQKTRRANLIQDKLAELIQEGTLVIATSGGQVGQVNGLSIISLGDYSFGLPVRITAETALGQEGVLNIERETRLSGPIHSKGFLILSSFLHGQYAQERPLAVSARITFEQTYDEIDGDSASSAELYALLSALAGIPLRQDIAVTGSIDQHGNIQPVGGVTQKIEGFFDVCQRRGLTGQQGVIIPAANAHNLMLRDEVVRAVSDGRFHVWAIHHVNEGIEILTGVAAGRREPTGRWETGTVHARVDEAIEAYAKRLKGFGPIPAGPAIIPTPPQIGPRAPRFLAALIRLVRSGPG